MPNPFYSDTELLIDADISPTGLAQQFKLPVSPALELSFTAGEFIFYDNNENALRNTVTVAATTANPAGIANGPRGGNNNTDSYLLYGQAMAAFKPSNSFGANIAAGFLSYLDNGGAGSPTAATLGVSPVVVGANFTGGGNGQGQAGNVLQNTAAFNSANATRNLFLGTFTGDLKFGFGAFKIKPYVDAVYNFRGGARDSEEYAQPGLDGTTDKVAFAAGVAIGSDFMLKKRGDYLLLAEYRQVGLGSVDPNLNDSDFNGSRLGFRGLKGAASYAFTPFVFGTVTGFFSNNLGSERNLNLGVANFNASQTIQVDLTVKF